MEWLEYLRSHSTLASADASAAAVDSAKYERPPKFVAVGEGGSCTIYGMAERDALVKAAHDQAYELRLVITALLEVLERRGGIAAGELASAVERVRLAVDKRYLGYEPGSGSPEEDNPFAGLRR